MITDELQAELTYNLSVMLMAAEYNCPEWAQEQIRDLIGKCLDQIPDKMTITIYEKEGGETARAQLAAAAAY